MSHPLYFTVVEDWEGKFGISSYLGETRSQERKYALTTNRKCHGVYTSFEDAERKLAAVKAKAPAK